ncbi:MAG: hypothetical protein SAJ37_22645, partial [Oscillatoria sp. PMC 1068.18]|nr:hypothetical protein [Oscillatoria sp. PMC 1068.18]
MNIVASHLLNGTVPINQKTLTSFDSSQFKPCLQKYIQDTAMKTFVRLLIAIIDQPVADNKVS